VIKGALPPRCSEASLQDLWREASKTFGDLMFKVQCSKKKAESRKSYTYKPIHL
jgi:hypothetical protein